MLMIHTLCPARPHWPWTLFMRMESFPILLLAVHRSAVGWPSRPTEYMNISGNPGPITTAATLGTGCTAPRHIHVHD